MEKKSEKKQKLSGLEMAALYGIIPNRLGFCGSQIIQEQEMLGNFLKGALTDSEIKPILKKFEAAYAYYEIIAKKNKIKNPLDKRVVEAYWIGNSLLEKVKKQDLEEMILKQFTKPGLLSKNQAKERLKKVANNSRPHHSFHVFILGTITGRVDLSQIKLKDICRVGWGRVKKINFKKSVITLVYQPIIRQNKIKLGKKKVKKLEWDKKIIPEIKIGDWISFHWNMPIQILNSDQVSYLRRYTQNTLKQL